MTTYRAKRGARFSNTNAQLYGECIERITGTFGKVTPEEVVLEGKRSGSPLHNYFEWNNKKAAVSHRLDQARYLLRHIEIEIIVNDETQYQRAFLNVDIENENEEKEQVYVEIQRALSEPELRKQILHRALREIKYWKERYKDYTELSNVFRAIDRIHI